MSTEEHGRLAYEYAKGIDHCPSCGLAQDLLDRIAVLRAALEDILTYPDDKDVRQIRGGTLKHIVFRNRDVAKAALGKGGG